jgi:hypothetical protein
MMQLSEMHSERKDNVYRLLEVQQLAGFRSATLWKSRICTKFKLGDPQYSSFIMYVGVSKSFRTGRLEPEI